MNLHPIDAGIERRRRLSVERAQRINRQLLARTFRRFAALDASALPLPTHLQREAPHTVLARRDFDRSASIVAVKQAGDCLSPWLHDGDVIWLDFAVRQTRPGDLVALKFAPADSAVPGFIKAMWPFGGRWFIASNEPPLPLHESLVLCATVVAIARFPQPETRTPALQAALEHDRLHAARIGYAWSANYLRNLAD